MTRQTKSTTDHDEIRRWAEARCGRPATVKGTESGDEPGVLRIDFPGYRGVHSLQEISWEGFFAQFDEAGLTFLYQEQTASGKPSRFCKLVSRSAPQKKRRAATAGR